MKLPRIPRRFPLPEAGPRTPAPRPGNAPRRRRAPPTAYHRPFTWVRIVLRIVRAVLRFRRRRF
jgi:hypothetical protein